MGDAVLLVESYMKVIQTVGIFSGILFFVLILLLAFLVWYIKYLGEKNIEKYKTELQSFNNLLLRNENPRQEVLLETIKKGNEIRLSIYEQSYSLFFKVLHFQHETKDNDELYKSLFDEIQILRERIFKNSIFLGGIFENLLEVQIALTDELQYERTNQLMEVYSSNRQFPLSKASNKLGEIAKWISHNMKTSQTLNEIELSDSDVEKIQQVQTEIIARQ